MIDHDTSHAAALERVAQHLPNLSLFVDVGAAAGGYTELFRQFWPMAHVTMVEAASAWEPTLKDFVRTIGNADFTIAAASNADGELSFVYDEDSPFGGHTNNGRSSDGAEESLVAALRLDTIVPPSKVPSQGVALKLDTHGHEVAILEGATNLMQSVDLLILETYNFGPASRRFGQMTVLLEEKYGLRCFDLVEPKWRPYDGALWQLDLFFVSERHSQISEWRLS